MKKHFAKEWMFYCYAICIIIAMLIFGSAAIEGRLPFEAADGRASLPMKPLEFAVFLFDIAAGFAFLGGHFSRRHYKNMAQAGNGNSDDSPYSTPDRKPYWS